MATAYTVSNGQISSARVLNGGDTLTVLSGGTAASTDVNSGSLLDNFGSSIETTISAGGKEIIEATGFGTGAVVLSGGFELVDGSTENTSVFAGGTAEVASGGTTFDPFISGGTLILDDGASATGAVLFRAGGEVKFLGPNPVAVGISGFTSGDTIDLAGLAHGSGSKASLGSGNVLQVTDGTGGMISLYLDPAADYTGYTFALASDGGTGTAVTVMSGSSGTVSSGGTGSSGGTVNVIKGPAGGFAIINGTSGNDQITANKTANVISGKGGDDVINAGSGGAVVTLGSGNSTVTLGSLMRCLGGTATRR